MVLWPSLFRIHLHQPWKWLLYKIAYLFCSNNVRNFKSTIGLKQQRTAQILWWAKHFFNGISKGQNWFVFTHSKCVFIKQKSKMEKWAYGAKLKASAGQIWRKWKKLAVILANTFFVKKLQCQSQIPDDKASLEFSKLDPVLDVIQKLTWNWLK